MCICVCICANNMQILGFGGVGGVRSGGGYHWGGGGGVWGSGDRAHIYIYMAFNMALFRQSFLGGSSKKMFGQCLVFSWASLHIFWQVFGRCLGHLFLRPAPKQ